MAKISITALNIRYFLWKKDKTERGNWAESLALLIGCEKTRAKELLVHGQFSSSELEKFAQIVGQTDSTAIHAPFFEERINVLLENVQYLLESVKQKDLAREIGVTKDTVSRWFRGGHNISPKHLDELRRFFRLPADIDLKTDAIFLSLTPFDDQRRREWLAQQIKEIDPDQLRDLFPAFERLFRE